MSNNLLERYKKWGERPDPTYKPPKAIRINTLKSTKRVIKNLRQEGFALKKHEELQDGYVYESDKSISSTPEYLTGRVYRQGIASQLPVEILNPEDTSTVLDMCAAPGSKTTQLAAWTKNKAKIVSLEKNNNRINTLRSNLDRCGAKKVFIYRKDARYADDLPFKYDYILLDPPCSGNYTQDKNFFSKRTLDDVKTRTKTQRELLEAAYYVLKKGGVLVYSTCSLEPEENEYQIDWFINNFRDIKLKSIKKNIGSEGYTEINSNKLDSSITKTKRLWPHKHGTEGFYIAKMVKQ